MQHSIKLFIIPYSYEAQHVSGDTPSVIRSLKLHWQPLVFHKQKVVGRVVVGTLSGTVRQCGFRLLIMGGVSPLTCWVSYKYGIIKILIDCGILLDFLYELYYDARIHEPQKEVSCHMKTFSRDVEPINGYKFWRRKNKTVTWRTEN
jgi:hypothetical protein